MALPTRWKKEPGARLEGARALDRSKVQAPGVVRTPDGRFRLFYTAVGPGRPFRACQGYILSAVSEDGLAFTVEEGIRVAPDPALAQMSLRVLAPSVAALPGGGWRMYFEARGTATLPTAIMSAVSDDQLNWRVEAGLRMTAPGGVGAPRFLRSAGEGGRLFCFESVYAGGDPSGGARLGTQVISAVSADGSTFMREPGLRLGDRHDALDSAGITAAEVVAGSPWRMVFSAWQGVPAGTMVPAHPSADAAVAASADFAAASIAADMAGYRSRILMASSADGINWERDGVIIDGDGYGGTDIDAVHAEDMSLVALDDGRRRMYYAACDAHGVWRIASAISD
ncbi:MAG: hypothetical protein J0I48_17705 [Devosia sp.]|uniref:hypothetical protein n=1 Tax=Devosia sp. 66-22 TaxID=1895753 RepID=UPI000AF3D2C2|nr:hypothetical protein [Devosia sp. 66-22]MBN9348007.1 hypothetical protein [Devosia sp.]